MSGNIDSLGARCREATNGAYSADVALLLALIDRLARNPAASVIDQALLGRIRASAKLLDQPKWIKERAKRRFYREWHATAKSSQGRLDD